MRVIAYLETVVNSTTPLRDAWVQADGNGSKEHQGNLNIMFGLFDNSIKTHESGKNE